MGGGPEHTGLEDLGGKRQLEQHGLQPLAKAERLLFSQSSPDGAFPSSATSLPITFT